MRPAMEKTSINRQKALEIAQKQCMPLTDTLKIYDSEPSHWSIYWDKKDEEYWYVERSGAGGAGVICSSHAIVISKKTGDVVYDGSAGDEG
jgi:hypothetical protein